jgi:hypothetical protein
MLRQFHLLPGIAVFQCFPALSLSASYSPVMTVHMITKYLLWINNSLTFNVTLFLVSPMLRAGRITNDITYS